MPPRPVVFEDRLAFDNPYGCWRWTHPLHRGYGYFNSEGSAHRYSYERTYGPVPEGLELDHFLYENPRTGRESRCIGPACVNPAHLRPVTHADNIRRKRAQLCTEGHPLDETGSRPRSDGGGRVCLQCEAAYRVKIGRNRGLRPVSVPPDQIAATVAAYEAAKAAGSWRPIEDAATTLGITRHQASGRLVKARGRKQR